MLSPTMDQRRSGGKAGHRQKQGERKRDRRNIRAVTTLVRPVRPPAAMPAALSAKVVVVEVPSTAPTEVPTASESSAPRMRGRRPFSSSMCPGSHADNAAQGVEYIYKEEGEHHCQKIEGEQPGEVHLHKGGSRLGTARPAEKSGRTLAMPSSALGT